MTPNDDTSPGGDSGGPTDTGGFRFGVADGGEPESDARTRTDGAGPTNSRFDFESWLGDSLPDVRGESDPVDEATDTEAASEAATPEFGGFGFGSWLESTDARTPPAAETGATSTDGLDSDEAAEATAAPSEFGGFTFGAWLEETESQASTTTAETDAASADSGYGGFAFGAWLGEAGSGGLAPVEAGDEPATERARATTETGVDESPAFPAPQSGGMTDAPPLKLAMFALFGATLVVVGLTVGGALAPLGPTDGFSSAAGGGEEAETEPAATATPTPTPTPDPTPDAAPDPNADADADPDTDRDANADADADPDTDRDAGRYRRRTARPGLRRLTAADLRAAASRYCNPRSTSKLLPGRGTPFTVTVSPVTNAAASLARN